MSDIWIKHDGGPMPIGPQVKVRVEHKNGIVSKWLAAKFHQWSWRPDAPGYDVIAYQKRA